MAASLRISLIAALLLSLGGGPDCSAEELSRAAPSKSDWTAVLQVGSEYDSNVLQAPQSSQASQTGRGDSSLMTFAFGERRAFPFKGSHVRAFAFRQDYHRVHSLDMLGVSGGLQQDFDLPTGRAKLAYDAQRFNLDRRPYLWIQTAAFDPEFSATLPWKTSLGYHVAFKRFIPQDFVMLDSVQHKVLLKSQWASKARAGSFGRLVSFKGQVEALREIATAGRFSHYGSKVGLEAESRLFGGLHLKLEPSARLLWYDPPDDPSQNRRRDIQQKYKAALIYAAGNHLSAEASYTFLNNGSTRGAFVYTKSLYDVSLSLSF